jgi:hypothetical protein
MQKTLTYNVNADLTSSKGYVDLARGYAIANRKMFDQVDGKGRAQTYVVEVEMLGLSTAARGCAIYTAPENWAVKNAIKKLHIARQKSFEKAGISLRSLPSYTRNLKMYLDAGHRLLGTMRPAGYSPTTTSTGAPTIQTFGDSEWLYTRLAHAAGFEGNSTTTDSAFADDYELHLMGDHVTQNTGTLQTYESVAVTQAYLEHRRNRSPNAAASTGDVIQEDPNPLTLLMNDSISGQEKAEIAQESQDVDPPYQVASGTWAGTDALDLHLASFLQTSQTYIRDRDVIRIPAGLCMLVGDPSLFRFHLHGIESMQG